MSRPAGGRCAGPPGLMARGQRASGVTLIELLVVMMILSLILTAAVKTWDVTLERGRFESTQRKMSQISAVIVGDPGHVVSGNRADFGYVGDIGDLPQTLDDLVRRPAGYPSLEEGGTWRGPYIRSTFQESPTGFRTDGWGDSLIYSRESLFVRSYGGRWLVDPTRWLTRMFGYSREQLLLNEVSGRVLDARGMPPDKDKWQSTIYFTVWLQRPRFGRLDTVLLEPPDPPRRGNNGDFYFGDEFAQGNQTELFVRYIDVPRGQIPPETTLTRRAITVYPGSGARDIQVRMNVDWDDYEPFE